MQNLFFFNLNFRNRFDFFQLWNFTKLEFSFFLRTYHRTSNKLSLIAASMVIPDTYMKVTNLIRYKFALSSSKKIFKYVLGMNSSVVSIINFLKNK